MQSKLIALALSAVIAAIGYFSGAVTAPEAIKQTLDPQGSITACVDLINETPKTEIKEAVTAERAEDTAE